jgi:hypothetical protein
MTGPDNYSTRERYSPTVDQFKELLKRANTRRKAILAGCRVEEALSRKKSDLELDYKLLTGQTITARVRIERGLPRRSISIKPS